MQQSNNFNSALENIMGPPAKIPEAKPDYTQALINQILGQNTSSKWTGQGHGSAQANAADMAKILSGIGISDVKQFGKVVKKDVPTEVRPDGRGGFVNPQTGKAVDPSLVTSTSMSGEAGDSMMYTAPVGTQEGWGNKLTGEFVPNTYSERQTGNFFGGTFAGKGNTGYGVQLDAQGNPMFYTQGASSNDLVNMFKDNPLLGTIAQAGAAYFGGPAGTAALAAAMGKKPVDILKSAALSYAGGQAANAVSGMEGINNILGKTGTNIAANTARQIVGSGGKVDPVQALLGSAINTGVDNLTSGMFSEDGFVPKALQGVVGSAARAALNKQPINQAIVGALANQAFSANDQTSGSPVGNQNVAATDNTFKPTQLAAAPVQSDTSPIQLMTDIFGTDIAKAQKTGARTYGFSGGGDIDELLQLLRS